jgi:glycosyltransferase involved in cell wall biosynthesis
VLSVITVVKNDLQGLAKTIKSVQSQIGIAIEHLIIDGGSSDGSAELAAKNNLREVQSYEDGGIYQGMQRGLALATGDYLVFLNSGDILIGSTFLNDAVKTLQDSHAFWGYGPMVEKNLRGTFSYTSVNSDNSLLKIAYRKSYIPFPAVIISREQANDLGGFSFDYSIAGDFDLLVRLAQISLPVTWNLPFALFSAGGVSYTKAPIAWKEEHQIRVSRLGLSGFGKLNSYQSYLLRRCKGALGKSLDLAYSLLQVTGSNHWRERMKIRVPEEILKVIVG